MKSNRIIGHQTLNWDQAVGLVNNYSVLMSGIDAIRNKVNVKSVTWEEAENYYYSLSSSDRNLIRKSGQQGKCHSGDNSLGWWDPSTQSHTHHPTDERGIMICRMYLNQDANCAYTLTGPYHILDFQVEHYNPTLGDCPENMILVAYNVNQNRKQSSMKQFIDRWQERINLGREDFDKWSKELETAALKGQQHKVKILNMTEDELANYAMSCPKEYEKYMWRVIGMSSLQPFRLRKDGVARPGGSQGNYKEVLNTVLYEYLYGSKELAKKIYNNIKSAASLYVNGKIQNSTYIDIMCEFIELSDYKQSDYNREKFTKKVLKNTYKWPQLN